MERTVFEAYERIKRCILSSNSIPQLETAELIVDLFRKQHSNPELNEKLYHVFVDKAKEFHYFDWKAA
ncbi:MAG TPA: hypothetical protein VL651_07060 [Bacteroidia bacterium]|jgi:hypothetical protein|nr:hypothetical protein [Bacteroidia bacterium]